MVRTTRPDAAWSDAGQMLSVAVVGECVLTFAVIAEPSLHQPRLLIAATGLAIASALIIARARMPARYKSGLIAALSATLLAMAAAVDPFGLRAVDRSFAAADAARDTTDEPTWADGRTMDAAVADIARDTDTAAFAADLHRAVEARAGGSEPFTATIDVAPAASGITYGLTWSIGAGDTRRWCGRIVAFGQDRAGALDSFAESIAAALQARREGAQGCA